MKDPIPDFGQWFEENDEHGPWLVVGKGPSIRTVRNARASGQKVITLNHAVKFIDADIAHVIDIDVIEECATEILESASALLLPWYPHFKYRCGNVHLERFAETEPCLASFRERRRLFGYNLYSAEHRTHKPIVHGTFSGSAVVDLLTKYGAKDIRLAGIDGGREYSAGFSKHTLLANGRSSFDVQFSEIAEVIKRTGASVKRIEEPIKVFIGADETQELAAQVLMHSIRTRTKAPVEFFVMHKAGVRNPAHKRNVPGTGFSFNRFAIPALTGFHGRAIYLDADMLVFADIEELWQRELNGHSILCARQAKTPSGWEEGKNNSLPLERHWTPGRQLSVMVMDCEALGWDVSKIVSNLDAGLFTYKELMTQCSIVPEKSIADDLPGEWNCLEWYDAKCSRLVHFTVVPTQPWKNDQNALVQLWEDEFKSAVGAGVVNQSVVESGIAAGHLKPSLLTAYDDARPLKIEAKSEAKTSSSPINELRQLLWAEMVARASVENKLNEINQIPAIRAIYRLDKFVDRLKRAVRRRKTALDRKFRAMMKK